MQHQLAGIRILAFVTLQRYIEQADPDGDTGKTCQDKQNYPCASPEAVGFLVRCCGFRQSRIGISRDSVTNCSWVPIPYSYDQPAEVLRG